MHLYLYGDSALELLRYLRCTYDERLLDGCCRIRSLSQPAHRIRDLDALTEETSRLLAHATTLTTAGDQSTIHTLVPERRQARARGPITNHLMSGHIPPGAFVRITDELFISSPAFIFVQLAQSLDPIELAKLGMELCGSYSFLDAASCSPLPNQQESADIEFQLPPVTTLAKMASFAENASWIPGAKRARKALPWLADMAASPYETAAYLLITLPRRLGGYGLPRPTLNPGIKVRGESGTEKRYPDLYWSASSIAVEYNSDYAHAGDWHRYRDSRRQAMLASNRITVLPLTREQLMNVDDFHLFVMGLQRLLGLRTRPFDADWRRERAQLRKALLLASRR